LISGKAPHLRAIVREERVNRRYAYRAILCAFLAPDIVEAILEGRQPADLTFETLTANVPMDWDEQRRVLGFAKR